MIDLKDEVIVTDGCFKGVRGVVIEKFLEQETNTVRDSGNKELITFVSNHNEFSKVYIDNRNEIEVLTKLLCKISK